MQREISEVRKHGIYSKGRTNLIKYLEDKRLTQRQAILAKCCDCTGYHADGRIDCAMPDCPLYPYMPYKEKGAAGTVSEKEDGKGREKSR
jgi:hypothetical protein